MDGFFIIFLGLFVYKLVKTIREGRQLPEIGGEVEIIPDEQVEIVDPMITLADLEILEHFFK
jgi:hypothetical protein